MSHYVITSQQMTRQFQSSFFDYIRYSQESFIQSYFILSFQDMFKVIRSCLVYHPLIRLIKVFIVVHFSAPYMYIVSIIALNILTLSESMVIIYDETIHGFCFLNSYLIQYFRILLLLFVARFVLPRYFITSNSYAVCIAEICNIY